MESNLTEFEQEPRIRPTLLTVLCILSFIGSGWSIISGVWAYTSASQSAQMISSVRNEKMNDSTFYKDSAMANGAHQKRSLLGEKIMLSVSKMMTTENIRKSSIGKIVSSLFTLAGAILMWFLIRRGFYIYIVGIIIGIIVPFYLYRNNLLAIGMSSFSSFFGLVFIALYALNIKNMK